jgi:hypothetical protein
MNKSEKVAEVISEWFQEYASVFEFDGRIEFDGLSLEDMKSVDVDAVWAKVAPVVQKLVKDYIEAQIEELDEE